MLNITVGNMSTRQEPTKQMAMVGFWALINALVNLAYHSQPGATVSCKSVDLGGGGDNGGVFGKKRILGK